MKMKSLVRAAGLGGTIVVLSSCAFMRSWIHREPGTRVDPLPAELRPLPDPAPAPKSHAETPVAKWTDDVPNTVWSPYLDGKKVDVSGIAPGTLVADPNCPEPMKSLFYVPEAP